MSKPSAIPTSLAAIASVIAASSCCLPIGTMWLAATAAGAGAFLSAARPYLMALSVALIAFGFWQSRRSKACNRKTRWLSLGLLYFASIFVGASLLFPQLLANVLAGGSPASLPASARPLVTIGFDDLSQLRAEWNADAGAVHVLVLLSPT